MNYRLFIFSMALGLCSFCKSPESSKKASAPTTTPATTTMQINQPIIKDKTIIRAIIFNHGEDSAVTIPPEQTDTIAAICMQLLSAAEPMRIALDEEEMAQLKINASGFELMFLPPLNTSADSTSLGKMLFLRSGNFSTSDLSVNARFFIALSHDEQYISSPYFAEAAADKVKRLDQILKNTN